MKSWQRTIVILAATLITCGTAEAQQPPSWAAWKFLVGDWVSEEGGGTPGQSSGGGSVFKLDLDGRILVRDSRSEYPATKDHPAFVHTDLMVLYAEPGGRVRADYWDSEGHVIRYTANADGKSATFLSDEAAGQPQYRLTYAQMAADKLKVTFEFAPPGKPFQKYVEGTIKRR